MLYVSLLRRGRDSNPRDVLPPNGFPYYIRFYTNHLQHCLFRCCSLDYFFTTPLYKGLGATCIVSTPFMKNLGLSLRLYFDWPFHPISQIIQFSKPPPNHIFLYKRFRFVRVVLLSRLKFPRGTRISTRPPQSTTLPPLHFLGI